MTDPADGLRLFFDLEYPLDELVIQAILLWCANQEGSGLALRCRWRETLLHRLPYLRRDDQQHLIPWL
jgi:hypothetical protein